jgi:hypothetical protein
MNRAELTGVSLAILQKNPISSVETPQSSDLIRFLFAMSFFRHDAQRLVGIPAKMA